MKCRPSLTDVAQRANCSKSTVSLALRNDPRIPEDTRNRVKAAAEEIHYRPDPALARIAAHRWHSQETPSGSTLAFITTNHPSGGLLDKDALVGARRQADRLGYRLEHFRAEEYKDPSHLGRVIEARGIRGVIIGQLCREDFITRFPWEIFTSIACGTGFYKPPIHLVMPDHAHAVRKAWDMARSRGYRRIGMLLFNEANALDDFDRISAFLYCQNRDSLDQTAIPPGHFDERDVEGLERWLRHHQPDCILGLNAAFYYWTQRGGLRIPEDMGFVALMWATDLHPCCLLQHNPELLGATAVEQVDIQLRTNQYGVPKQPSILMIEAFWQEGVTLPVRSTALVL